MSGGVLLIGENEQQHIALAIELARQKPIPLEVLVQGQFAAKAGPMRLSDRPPGIDDIRKEYPPQNVMLGTYRAAISFEQQPAGLARHVSVSSRDPGKLPGPEVMAMVCEAFGYSEAVCARLRDGKRFPKGVGVWVEEFDPGHFAINVLE